MTLDSHYTTNLSKAQGMVPETLELLDIWEPGLSVVDLKARVRAMGALGKATQLRVDDMVGRGFAQRYLIDDARPARWLQKLLRNGGSRSLLRQLTLIYTARANLILHDFIREVFWRKYASRAGEVTKQDAQDFIEKAVVRGALEKRWSDSVLSVYTHASFEAGSLYRKNLGCGKQRGEFITPEKWRLPIEVAAKSFLYSAAEVAKIIEVPEEYFPLDKFNNELRETLDKVH